MNRLRLALAGAALVAAGSAPLASSAHAAACHPDFRQVCETAGIPCRKLADYPKLGLECPPLG